MPVVNLFYLYDKYDIYIYVICVAYTNRHVSCDVINIAYNT